MSRWGSSGDGHAETQWTFAQRRRGRARRDAEGERSRRVREKMRERAVGEHIGGYDVGGEKMRAR